MPLYVSAATDLGHQRSANEDAHQVLSLGDDDWLLVVCDGMGGHEGGRLASSTAVAHIADAVRVDSNPDPGQAIGAALAGAHEAVLAAAHAGGVPGAGSTGVVARVRGRQMWYGWVGDSRLYHFRGAGCVERSEDHTRVADMVKHGILSAADAKNHPDAHILSRALGGSGAPGDNHFPTLVAPDAEHPLEDGDLLVLCSDGLYDLVDDEEIPRVCGGLDLPAAARALVDLANARGGYDNITVVLACLGSPTVPLVTAPSDHAPRRTWDDAPGPAAPMPAAPRETIAAASPSSGAANGAGRHGRESLAVSLRMFVLGLAAALIFGIVIGAVLGGFGLFAAGQAPAILVPGSKAPGAAATETGAASEAVAPGSAAQPAATEPAAAGSPEAATPEPATSEPATSAALEPSAPGPAATPAHADPAPADPSAGDPAPRGTGAGAPGRGQRPGGGPRAPGAK
ncbi:MAG: protein phosphatase 2C domain-containing protein [Deltaproteobacteria bacterium]|nr:protein phosphatase 2C domain-containing protein [Deltaproteobacteria bacterium]